MKLEGCSRRVKVGVRRDRLIYATLDLIRDIKSNDVRNYQGRKSLIRRMENNQRLIKKYGEEIYKQYLGKDHIELFTEMQID